MTTPLLSVLIDTYNHERYIEQAVVSAIEQDFPSSKYEIVVVDDGSTDRTPEIVRKFAPRVRLLQKKNGGQASAFNAGFRELRGEIVAFLDGDDWFAPNKLRAVMSAFENHPQIAAVGHGYRRFNDESGQTEECACDEALMLNLNTPAAAIKAHDSWSYLLMGALTVKKRAIDRVMPVPEALRFCADVPIVMAALLGGVCVLPEMLFYYRHHANNLFSFQDQSADLLRRRTEMTEMAFEKAEPMIVELGGRRECVAAFLYPQWVEMSRSALRTRGGSRRRVFKTEMRALQMETNPTLAYRIFKYAVVGAATFALTAQQFYRAREWYGRKDLGRVRERIARTTKVKA